MMPGKSLHYKFCYLLLSKPPFMFAAIIPALILGSFFTANESMYSPIQNDRPIVITVTEKGMAITGRDTLTIIELTDELRTRLWKSYLGTGKMPPRIQVIYDEKVPSSIKEEIEKAVREGQAKALTEICLQKHKKRFDEISSSQQKKIKKRFPVLFQQKYSNS